jgi:hypothetical protein
MVVTQQYLIGELSLLLSNVAAVATNDDNVEEALRLRRRAETSTPEDLTAVAVSALRLTDVLCLMSLSRGDTTAFTAQVEVSRGLYEFGVCSGLFDEF